MNKWWDVIKFIVGFAPQFMRLGPKGATLTMAIIMWQKDMLRALSDKRITAEEVAIIRERTRAVHQSADALLEEEWIRLGGKRR